MRLFVVSLSFVAMACSSPSATPPPGKAPSAPPAIAPARPAPPAGPSASTPPPAPVLEPLAWGTRPSGDGPLYPLVDGMCIHGKIHLLEDGALFAYGMGGVMQRGAEATVALVGEHGIEPQPGLGIGKGLFYDPRVFLGKPPHELLAISASPLRVQEASSVQRRLPDQNTWKATFEGDPSTRRGSDVRYYSIAEQHLARTNGTTLVAIKTESDSGNPLGYGFQVLNADGTVTADKRVPGPDLAELAFRGVIGILANGEVLGAGTDRLVRWSPTSPVADLKLPKDAKGPTELRVGKSHAFLRAGERLFVYDGSALRPVSLTPRLGRDFTFSVGEGDTLFVQQGDTGYEEAVGGEIREQKLPAAGPVLGAGTATPWLVARAPNTSDRVFRRVAGTWQAVPLPAPPFGSELRGTLTIEEFQVLPSGDAFVNVRRIEKGYGWREVEPFRTIYTTRKPAQVVRCGDARGMDVGRGFHAWAPAADASCKTPVVFLLHDGEKPLADYPNLRAALRGKTEFGSTLTFVNFEGRGGANLAVLVSDFEQAKALATLVSKKLDLRAEVACGAPTPIRRFTFDVAKGTFAF